MLEANSLLAIALAITISGCGGTNAASSPRRPRVTGIDVPRVPATNPLSSHRPLFSMIPNATITCGDATQLPAESYHVEATADQLCLTVTKYEDHMGAAPQQRINNGSWRLISGERWTEMIKPDPEAKAPEVRHGCRSVEYARAGDQLGPGVQVGPNGRLIRVTPVDLYIFSLHGCVANQGVLTPESRELVLLRPQAFRGETEWAAWSFTGQ
jgi:hypothetical protein